MSTPTNTPDAALIALLAIREKITACRHQGLHLTASTLRHEAMSLAERFVDPVWMDEEDTISPELRRACREMAAERVAGLPF
jgi:hypothetical protein